MPRRRQQKAYSLHSSAVRFTVYCTEISVQEELLQHILRVEGEERFRAVVVARRLATDGTQKPSSSARRSQGQHNSIDRHSVPRAADRGSSDDSDSSDDDESDSSDSEIDIDYEAVGARPVYAYYVYLHYHSTDTVTRSSRKWAATLFQGFTDEEYIQVTTAHAIGHFKEADRDEYVVTLLLQPHVAVYGVAPLEVPGVKRLIVAKYTKAEQEDDVREAIARHASLRVKEDTKHKLLQEWRLVHDIGNTIPNCVAQPLVLPHPFLPLPACDDWVKRWVGSRSDGGAAPLDRAAGYKPLVLICRKRNTGKSKRAQSLAVHVYMRGAIDPIKIHHGLRQGAQLIVLDDCKWHALFTGFGRALLSGQDEVTWVHKGERITTKFTAPVIVLNNKKPRTWGENDKTYWKDALVWIKAPKTLLYDPSVDLRISPAPSTSSSSSSSPVPSSSSSSPVPSSSPSSSPPCTDLLAFTLQPSEKKAVDGLPDTWIMYDGITPEVERFLDERLESEGDEWIEFTQARNGKPLKRLKKLQCTVIAPGWVIWYWYPDSRPLQWIEFTPVNARLCRLLAELTGEPINSLVANKYRTLGDEIIGHQDKTGNLVPGSSIVTLSTGAVAREVVFTRVDAGSEGPTIRLSLPPRSVYSIGPLTNAEWKHAVPAMDSGEQGVRYGWTFRSIASVFNVETHTCIQRPAAGSGATWDVLRPTKNADRPEVLDSYTIVQTIAPADPTRVQVCDLAQASAAAEAAYKGTRTRKPYSKGKKRKAGADSQAE